MSWGDSEWWTSARKDKTKKGGRVEDKTPATYGCTVVRLAAVSWVVVLAVAGPAGLG